MTLSKLSRPECAKGGKIREVVEMGRLYVDLTHSSSTSEDLVVPSKGHKRVRSPLLVRRFVE